MHQLECVTPTYALMITYICALLEDLRACTCMCTLVSLKRWESTKNKLQLQHRTSLTVALMTSTLNAPGWWRVLGRSRRNWTTSMRPCFSKECLLSVRFTREKMKYTCSFAVSQGPLHMHIYYTRSPLPGVRNSVVFIQSGSGHDNDQVQAANCSKAGSKINHPL